jgi:hypothetical protein
VPLRPHLRFERKAPWVSVPGCRARPPRPGRSRCFAPDATAGPVQAARRASPQPAAKEAHGTPRPSPPTATWPSRWPRARELLACDLLASGRRGGFVTNPAWRINRDAWCCSGPTPWSSVSPRAPGPSSGLFPRTPRPRTPILAEARPAGLPAAFPSLTRVRAGGSPAVRCLILTQSRDRVPARYGLPRRLATTPSHPRSLVAANRAAPSGAGYAGVRYIPAPFIPRPCRISRRRSYGRPITERSPTINRSNTTKITVVSGWGSRPRARRMAPRLCRADRTATSSPSTTTETGIERCSPESSGRKGRRSLPRRDRSRVSSPSWARHRKPSHLGSKAQPWPFGSSRAEDSSMGRGRAVTAGRTARRWRRPPRTAWREGRGSRCPG